MYRNLVARSTLVAEICTPLVSATIYIYIYAAKHTVH